MSNEQTISQQEEDQFGAVLDAMEAAKAPASELTAAQAQPDSPQSTQAQAPAVPLDPNQATQAEHQEAAELFPGYNRLSHAARQKCLDLIEAGKTEGQKAADAALKEKAEIEQRWKAQHNQLAPVQRQNTELLKRLDAIERERKEALKPKTDPSKEARIKELAETFPMESEYVREVLTPYEQRIKMLEEQQERAEKLLQRAEHDRFITEQKTELTQFRPTWQEDVPVLDKWLAALDDDQREHYLTLLNTPLAKNSILVWKEFQKDEELAKLYMQQNQTPPNSGKRPPIDKDPNPRNRQSPVLLGNAASTEEDAYAAANGL